MPHLDMGEGAGMFGPALGVKLDAISRYLLALFMENRDDIRGGTSADTHEEHLEGSRSGFSPTLDIYHLSVAARGEAEEKLVPGVLDRGETRSRPAVAHSNINSTGYTENRMVEPLTLRRIQSARQLIAPCIRRTPLTPSTALSERFKANVYVKLEVFQKTGSFKVRGAFHKILGLSKEERGRGVVAVSGGNHAQAVAHAARTLGLKSVILMPSSTPQNYVDATKAYGAEIQFAKDVREAFAAVSEFERQGWAYVHPFNDTAVMAGQGTIGLEILDDVPQVTDIIVSIGGGGLMSGIATAVKSLKPSVKIWGVETEGADCMAQSLASGQIVTLKQITSVARTLGAPAPSDVTLQMAKTHLEGVMVVSDKEALKEVRYLLERLKVLTEPAASCTVAAAERLKDRFNKERHVVLVLCGGNMPMEDLKHVF